MIPGRQVAAPSLSGRKRPRPFDSVPQKARLFAGLIGLLAWRALALGIHFYVGAVAVEHLGTDTFDLAQVVSAAECAVFLSVCNDRLRATEADALQFLGDRGGVGSVDVDRSSPHERRHERDDEGVNEFEH